jgi:hypothetical protein
MVIDTNSDLITAFNFGIVLPQLRSFSRSPGFLKKEVVNRDLL